MALSISFPGLTFSHLTSLVTCHLEKVLILYLKVISLSAHLIDCGMLTEFCLTGKFNEWIQTIHGISKALSVAWSIRSFPLFEKTYHYFLPASIRRRGAKHFAYARAKVHKSVPPFHIAADIDLRLFKIGDCSLRRTEKISYPA